MEFLVSLIKAEPTQEILDNCTHIIGKWWFYEGMLEVLETPFSFHSECAVPSLGCLSTKEKIKLAVDLCGVTEKELAKDLSITREDK